MASKPFDPFAENLAELLYRQSCTSRGLEPQWRGRRTNRAYYRRLAKAQQRREALQKEEAALSAPNSGSEKA